MAGTIPLSMTQQMDQYGDPLSGGKLYGIVAGTVSTPQNFFQDIALTRPWPNPITLDVAGRVPQLFLADGLIKIRLTDSSGVVQLSSDNVQVIGASAGGGSGGGTVDATTVFQTGDIKKRYGVGIHTGWVRANARTIGNTLSGATELADTSAQALFIYLYGADPNLVVIGGRSGNALNDFNAGRQLTLPDGRGTLLAGMDDMGGTAANRLTTAYGVNGIVLGARGGAQNHTLLSTQVPATTFTNALSGFSIDDINHYHGIPQGPTDPIGNSAITGGSGIVRGTQVRATNYASDSGFTLNNHRHFVSGAIDGGGQAHPNVQPTMVITFYLKL